jgi:toxin secretion/phage lysis holin
MEKIIKLICGTVGGIIGFLFGELDGLLIALLTVIVIDYATGLVCAKIKRNLSSSIGFRGIAKKGFMLSIVVIANIIDTQIIKNGSAFRSAVICFYLANESISILENAGNMGVPLPKKLKDILIQLREDNK